MYSENENSKVIRSEKSFLSGDIVQKILSSTTVPEPFAGTEEEGLVMAPQTGQANCRPTMLNPTSGCGNTMCNCTHNNCNTGSTCDTGDCYTSENDCNTLNCTTEADCDTMSCETTDCVTLADCETLDCEDQKTQGAGPRSRPHNIFF